MMSLKSLVLAAVILNYVSYIWSVIGIFENERQRKKGPFAALLVVSPLTWMLSLIELWRARPSSTQLAILLVFQLFFLYLFWWTVTFAKKNKFSMAYSLDQPKILIKEGPYKYLRNPVYTSYLGTYFSIAFLTPAPLTLVSSLFMFYLYTKAARLEENKFENSPLKADYELYKSQTGMFFPKRF